jgi:hypothetical protein
LAGLLYALVPPRCAYGLGARLTRALYPLFRKRRRIAVDNILKAGVATDPREAGPHRPGRFRPFAGHLCEALKTGAVIGPHNWRDHITFDGPAESWKLLMESPDVPVMILHRAPWRLGSGRFRHLANAPDDCRRPQDEQPLCRTLPEDASLPRADHDRFPRSSGSRPASCGYGREQKAAMTLLMDQHAGPKHA